MDFSKITAWVKSNPVIAGLIVVGIVLVAFPKLLHKVFGGTRRVHHRRKTVAASSPRRRVHYAITGSHRRTVSHHSRRSHGTRKRLGGTKKPWQIKGSLAAKRRMALIRKRRAA